MNYTYPPAHPKAGKTTTILVNVWQFPICNYTTNLADDKKEHIEKHRKEAK